MCSICNANSYRARERRKQSLLYNNCLRRCLARHVSFILVYLHTALHTAQSNYCSCFGRYVTRYVRTYHSLQVYNSRDNYIRDRIRD